MKHWVANIVLLGVSLCIALLVGEFVLRLADFSFPVFWTYDDIVGSTLRPGAEGWQRGEGEAFVRINSEGLRDREHSKTKPANTIRIAVLGDSMAEALQVPAEATFWSVLERRVKECKVFGARNVEVLNFGVSGYGTAQELLTLRHRVAAYAPDLVVLAFYPGNDVRNNSRELEPMKLRPFFRVDGGALVLDDGFLRDPAYLSYKRNFALRSKLFDLRLFQLLHRSKVAIDQFFSEESRSPRVANLELGSDEKIFFAPNTAAWKDAWEVTERLIVEMRDEAGLMGAQFLLVSIPIAIQANPDPKVRDQFMRDLGTSELFYPDGRLRTLADKKKLDVVLLAQSFQSYAEKNRVYLHGFNNTALGSGHLNKNGHRLAGELLADYVCQSH